MRYEPILYPWNIWRFRGVTVPQPDVIVARKALPCVEAQSEYCRILDTVTAATAADAMAEFSRKAGAR